MDKRIEVCIGTSRDNTVRVRLSLIVFDENSDLSENFHSMNLAPGDSLEDARTALESHLSQNFSVSGIPGAPWPPIPDEEWQKVTGVIPVFHTKSVVEAYQSRLRDASEKLQDKT